jgi:hypothetical protein
MRMMMMMMIMSCLSPPARRQSAPGKSLGLGKHVSFQGEPLLTERAPGRGKKPMLYV